MSDTPLFPDLPESVSPRLAWIESTGVSVFETHIDWVSARDLTTGEAIGAFTCSGKNAAGLIWLGFGDSEDDAILDWCNKSGVPHWTVAADTNSVPEAEKNQGGSR